MFGKVCKVVKELAIGVLLVLSLLLVISGSLKTAGVIEKPEIFLMLGEFLKNIEYGNVSDWISATSSIITLIIAGIAYLKWQENKYRDDSYELQKRIITKHYFNLFKSLSDIDSEVTKVRYKCIDLNHSLKNSVIEEMQENFINLMSNLEKSKQEIIGDIQILSMFNCYLKDKFRIVNHNILLQIEITITSIKTITTSLSGVKMDEIELFRKKSLNYITGAIAAYDRSSTILGDGRKFIYESDIKLHEFFEFKVKNENHYRITS